VSAISPIAAEEPGSRRWPIVLSYGLAFLLLLPALLWGLGGRLDNILRLPRTTAAARPLGYVLLATGGLWTAFSMLWLSARGRGLPISHLPPRQLVGSGPYRISRHPIYLGAIATVAGAGLADRSAGRGIVAPLLLALACLAYVLGFEEARLTARFGPDYAAYSRRTPLLRFPGRRLLGALAGRAWSLLRPPLERLADRPVLFRLGPTIWMTYGLFVALAIPPMVFVEGQIFLDAGWSKTKVFLVTLGFAASMTLGARVLWLVLYAPVPPWRDRATLRQVGFVSWGVYAGLIAFALVLGWAQHKSPLWLLDRAIPVGLLGSAVGRLGCLTYGCCYGRPTERGIRWRAPESKVVRELGPEGSVPRIPTQLLSSLHAGVVAVTVLELTRRGLPTGAATGFSMVLYALGRFTIEAFRDPATNRTGHRDRAVTIGQMQCMLIFAVGLVILLTVHGPSSWPQPARLPTAATLSDLWPAALALAALVFVPVSLHLRRVGRW
jgi:phosphatidylglycerol---prolipoprotein diacylglyceryl transferase